MNTSNRNDVKQLAQQIENLAKEVQVKVESGADFLDIAQELVRNNVTFLFTIGEVYALEQSSKTKVVSNPNNTNVHYYNVRDSLGRFTRNAN